MAYKLYKGSTNIAKVYKGSTNITKIYKGSSLIWNAEIFYIFTINPTPSNAKVIINGEVTNSATILEGTEVSYEVSLDGYITQSGTVVVNKNTTLNVVLEEDGPLYACYKYPSSNTFYFYVKRPLGSDKTLYCSSKSTWVEQPLASNSSELIDINELPDTIAWGWVYTMTSVTEEELKYHFSNANNTAPRVSQYDLYT